MLQKKKDLKPFQLFSAHRCLAQVSLLCFHFTRLCLSTPCTLWGGGFFPLQLICIYLITNHSLNLRSTVPPLESIPQSPILTEMLPSLSPHNPVHIVIIVFLTILCNFYLFFPTLDKLYKIMDGKDHVVFNYLFQQLPPGKEETGNKWLINE